MVSSIHITGRVRLSLWNDKGWLKVCRLAKNVVTEGAFALIAQHLGGGAAVLPTHIAVGSGGTFPDPTQLVLDTELERVALVDSFIGRQVNYTATIGAGLSPPVSILEAGIFDDAVAGTMWARFLTGQIDFEAGDSLDIEWELTVGSIV